MLTRKLRTRRRPLHPKRSFGPSVVTKLEFRHSEAFWNSRHCLLLTAYFPYSGSIAVSPVVIVTAFSSGIRFFSWPAPQESVKRISFVLVL